ncbi:MAG: ferritin family protein [Desulfobulbaceae bacterium]|nr:ferritin family protein [Desulfobulbaceae bacterium]
MDGGINAWQGGVATGDPEAGMAFFDDAVRFDQLVALACGLEEGTRLFYNGVGEQFAADNETATLMKKLTDAEDRHRQHLLAAYRTVAGEDLDMDALHGQLGDNVRGRIMEGGIEVATALAWAAGRSVNEIMDLAMSLEMNAYDLYLKMGRVVENDKAASIFRSLAKEEHQHLQQLSRLRDQRS